MAGPSLLPNDLFFHIFLGTSLLQGETKLGLAFVIWHVFSFVFFVSLFFFWSNLTCAYVCERGWFATWNHQLRNCGEDGQCFDVLDPLIPTGCRGWCRNHGLQRKELLHRCSGREPRVNLTEMHGWIVEKNSRNLTEKNATLVNNKYLRVLKDKWV